MMIVSNFVKYRTMIMMMVLTMVRLFADDPAIHAYTIHHQQQRTISTSAYVLSSSRSSILPWSTCSSSSSTRCYSSLSDSLNEDGDFLIPGINDNGSLSSSSSDLLMSSSSSDPNTQEQQVTSLLEILQYSDVGDKKEQQHQQLLSVSNNKNPGNELLGVDEDATRVLADFLASIFSSTSLQWNSQNENTGSSTLLNTYARELANIGFDPDCDEISIELKYEDLTFMKLLHRRYFWKEWNKLIS